MALSRKALSGITLVLIAAAFAAATYLRIQVENQDDEEPEVVESAAGENAPASASEQFNTEIPQPVSGVEAVRDTLWISVAAVGEAAPIRSTTLKAQVAGVVLSVPTRENRAVGGGALLVQIDTTEYALDVLAAEAAKLQAEGDYRSKTLFDDEIEDPEVRAQRDRMARSSSQLDQREAELKRAQLQLDKTGVRAPFAGRVADLKVVPGQYVNVGDDLATVVDLDPIKVEIQVLEREIGHLSEGREVSMTFAAFPDEVFTGRIETMNPLVDSEARTARVTVHVRNSDGRLKPGMYARARLAAEEFPDRILVPRVAILERNRRHMLYVFEEGRAKWRYVTLGFENDSLVELTDGDEDWVAAGEVVLTAGHQYLTHDAAVRLVENAEEAGGRPNR